MDINSVGKNIRKARKAAKIRQEDLAEYAGLSVKYIGMIERGEKTPALETLIKIANCLGVSSDMLLHEVLINGYKLRGSLLADKVDTLPNEEKSRIYDVVDILIKHAQKD